MCSSFIPDILGLDTDDEFQAHFHTQPIAFKACLQSFHSAFPLVGLLLESEC